MTAISFHPASAVAGAGILGLFLMATGGQGATEITVGPSDPKMVRVEGIPTWDQMVRIKEGEQYIVPQGKVLVLTGIVWSEPIRMHFADCTPSAQPSFPGFPSANWTVRLDSTPVLIGNQTVRAIPTGYVVTPGTLVEVDDSLDCVVTQGSGSNLDVIGITLLGYLQEM